MTTTINNDAWRTELPPIFAAFVCKHTVTRYAMDVPFIMDGCITATDGRVCVRGPAKLLKGATPRSGLDGVKPPPCSELPWSRDKYEDEAAALPEIPAPTIETCEACEGKDVPCESCDGDRTWPRWNPIHFGGGYAISGEFLRHVIDAGGRLYLPKTRMVGDRPTWNGTGRGHCVPAMFIIEGGIVGIIMPVNLGDDSAPRTIDAPGVKPPASEPFHPGGRAA